MKLTESKVIYWGALVLLLVAVAAVHCSPNNGTTTTATAPGKDANPSTPKPGSTTMKALPAPATAGGTREAKQLDLEKKENMYQTNNSTTPSATGAAAKLEGNSSTTAKPPSSGAGSLTSFSYAIFALAATFILV
jgi:hypothetical protein